MLDNLKKLDGNGYSTDTGNDQSIFVLVILGKIKETRQKVSRGSVTIL